MKVLHLIDSFGFNGGARQLQVLGPALGSDAISIEVCCLGPETVWLQRLREAGVIVHALDWTRWFDPSVFWNLRAILREVSPDVIHVWRLPALRALAVAAPHALARVVMNASSPSNWIDQQLFSRVKRLAQVAPALEKRCWDPFSKSTPTSIVCVARLERAYGIREAVWAFDFVRHMYPQVRLQIVGAGSQQPALETLVHGMESAEAVCFLGPRGDVADVLADADVVWVPSRANCGRQTALDAMALGRAVIASNVPCLSELIDDGTTGCLTPPGDVIALVRQTRALLRDPALRERLGSAAKTHVESRFPLARTVERWREIYLQVAA